MNFFTWNSQGKFSGAAKKVIIKDLFDKRKCLVGFIQEGGNGGDMRGIGDVKAYGGITVGR